MISFDHVTRKFEDTVALDNVSFDIDAGEVVGLLGLNGAGKTTMLRLMTGSLSPSSGTIRIGVDQHAPQTLQAQRQIGYLPEHCPLYDDMPVYEYLSYIAGLRGLDGDEQRQATHRIGQRLGLDTRFSDSIRTLSKGYRQRVGLAQALIHQPAIAILDEPTSGLDPNQIDDIRQLLRELGSETTVLLSTHNLHEVAATCDRAMIVVQGRIGSDVQLKSLDNKSKALSDLFRDAHHSLEASK